ncbi:hypothetical protein HHL22_09565 [Hymenobacter sp. RP-2-7]|uniref:Uncharacterized protein n=1 Tax=Hymenobacter polaris TaxID=2682546 RepID=A0A7Y0ADT3_9BACT|nr:hypothetical protein [Hymenobacter polaris]NML65451.1 hypothetical protein [Hymenobacter polaris]
MSEFSDQWAGCMHSSGLPVPDVEDANEALEVLDKIHSAWENAGGEAELTIGALLATGLLTVAGGAVVPVLEEIVTVTVAAYLGACIGCLGSVAYDSLKSLFASGQLPAFVVAELESQGVDIQNEAVA